MALDNKHLEFLFKRLGQWHADTEPGLSYREIEAIEAKYSFKFPPDLRQFLHYRLPVSEGWVNWRGTPEDKIRERLDWPVEGICFDIEFNKLWLADWGPWPGNLQDALRTARAEIAKAPVMIPIYSHRYIPAEPCEEGNPVFSIHQTDIIYYGYDLTDYLSNEFKVAPAILPDDIAQPPPFPAATNPRPIRFWDQFVG